MFSIEFERKVLQEELRNRRVSSKVSWLVSITAMDFLCLELLFHLGLLTAAFSSSSLVWVAMLLESQTEERKEAAEDRGAVHVLILEAGLGKFVNSADDYLGRTALEMRPATQMIRPVAISGDIPVCDRAWPVYADGRKVGQVTSAVFSPDFATNVSIGMIADSHWDAGTQLEIETQDGMRDGVVQAQFWN